MPSLPFAVRALLRGVPSLFKHLQRGQLAVDRKAFLLRIFLAVDAGTFGVILRQLDDDSHRRVRDSAGRWQS